MNWITAVSENRCRKPFPIVGDHLRTETNIIYFRSQQREESCSEGSLHDCRTRLRQIRAGEIDHRHRAFFRFQAIPLQNAIGPQRSRRKRTCEASTHPTVSDCRRELFCRGSRGNGYGNSHRDEEVAREKIRERWPREVRHAVVWRRPSRRSFRSIQTSGRETLNQALQIHRSHRIGVDAHVRRKET